MIPFSSLASIIISVILLISGASAFVTTTSLAAFTNTIHKNTKNHVIDSHDDSNFKNIIYGSSNVFGNVLSHNRYFHHPNYKYAPDDDDINDYDVSHDVIKYNNRHNLTSKNYSTIPNISDRRTILQTASSLGLLVPLLSYNQIAHSNDALINIDNNSSKDTTFKPTDEITIQIRRSDLFPSSNNSNNNNNPKPISLGLELSDITYQSSQRIYVKSIQPNSLASQFNIQPNWILVKVQNQPVERMSTAQVVKESILPILQQQQQQQVQVQNNSDLNDVVLSLTFRDTSSFRNDLKNNLSQKEQVTTQIVPTTSTSSSSQVEQSSLFTVQQLIPPKYCTKGAQIDDLLEISYIGTVVDTGAIFDGVTTQLDGRGVPGRGGDTSLFFVLGKQPVNQFPPGWDIGLEGICVGERRRLIIPPSLAYGSTGVPRRNIPPNATLQYDITLLSINGLATPQ